MDRESGEPADDGAVDPDELKVAADGKLYAASARGVISVVRLGRRHERLANNDLGERIMATPAIVDGRIYLRGEQHLWCFALPR